MTTLYCKYIINKTLKNRREIRLMRCVEFVVFYDSSQINTNFLI